VQQSCPASRTYTGTNRSAAFASPTASSVVEPSLMPRALHSTTPSGTTGLMWWTPALNDWAYRGLGIRAIGSGRSRANGCGMTDTSTPPMLSGAVPSPSKTSARQPAGTADLA